MRQDPLYQLIDSLSASEKRYLRLTCDPDSANMALFDALHTLPHFDDALLLDHFPDHSFARHLPAAKHKLRKRILKSLRAFHEEKQVQSEIRMRMEECQVLINRLLWVQALKVADAALKKAEKYQLLPAMVELLDLKLNLASEKLPGKAHQQIQAIIAQKERVLELIRHESQLNAWYRETRIRYLANANLNHPETVAWTDQLLQAPLLGSPCTSFRGEIYRLATRSIIHFGRREMPATFQLAQQARQLYRDHPHFRTTDPPLYLRAMLHLLNSALYEGQQAEFLDCMDEIQSILPRLPGNLFDFERRINYLELFYCLNFSNETRGRRLIQELPRWLEQHAQHISIPSQLGFRYNFTAFYFLHANYKQALHCAQQILHHASSEHRKDLQRAAEVYQLIIHFQLENTDVLEYLHRSYVRAQTKSSPHHPYARFVADLVRSLLQAPDPETRHSIFSRAHAELPTLLQDLPGKLPAGSQELLFWLDSRVQGRSIRDVYRAALVADGRLDEAGE